MPSDRSPLLGRDTMIKASLSPVSGSEAFSTMVTDLSPVVATGWSKTLVGMEPVNSSRRLPPGLVGLKGA